MNSTPSGKPQSISFCMIAAWPPTAAVPSCACRAIDLRDDRCVANAARIISGMPTASIVARFEPRSASDVTSRLFDVAGIVRCADNDAPPNSSASWNDVTSLAGKK